MKFNEINERNMYMKKKLFKSETDKKLCGVCGGIGQYFNIDPTIIRILAVILAVCSFGTAVIVYFGCALIIPKDNGYTDI